MSTGNGTKPDEVALAEAIANEELIAKAAKELRGETIGLTPALFLKLWPLLREPIPKGFITHVGAVTGKPYESDGVKSVQVQINRMDNVLTPLGWRERREYSEGGKLCEVTVEVLADDGTVLFDRSSRGGVDRANTIGNLHKGSYTNAAKLAFARVGPGHEVYLGAVDLDPDVHQQTAEQQTKEGEPAHVPVLKDASRQKVLKAFKDEGIEGEELNLFFTGAGISSPDEMTAAHAIKLRELLDAHKAKQVQEPVQ